MRCVRYGRHLSLKVYQRYEPKYNWPAVLSFDLGIRGVCGLDCQSNTSNNSHTAGEDHESFEIIAQHALGFIVIASTSLLVLFFFKIYNVVKIMRAFGCSGALMQIVIHPSDARSGGRVSISAANSNSNNDKASEISILAGHGMSNTGGSIGR